ncbi:ABC transporter permease subunit [Nocardioides marmoraquaticus]
MSVVDPALVPQTPQGEPTGPSTWDRIRTYSPPGRYTPVIVTVVLLVSMFGVGGTRYDNFLQPQTLFNLLINNAFLIVLAVGMTFVILTGGIDLSVGSTVALSTMVLARMLEGGQSVWLAVATVLVVATLLGTLMGLLIHYLDIQPFIATLAGLFLARGISFMISDVPIPISDRGFLDFSYEPLVLWGTYSIRWSVVVALVVVAVAIWVLGCTRFGRTVYAIGGNEGSALLMGLKVAAAKVGVYAISGLCAGVAGLLFALYTPAGNSLSAVGAELDAIAAVVIGGTLLTGGRGLVVGSVLGVLVLGTINQFIILENLNSWWTRIVIGALVLVFVVVQRLLARRES